MTDDHEPDPRVLPASVEATHTRRNMRAAITFGVVMATIEMGVLLYFAYC